jgi:predicted RNase H-like HicB family nuclease
MNMIRVQANVQWQVRPSDIGQPWVAICEPLKLTVQGETWGDLMESIADTLDAVLSDLMQTNELPQFLQSHGWALMTPLPAKQQDVRFDVPFIPWMGENGPQAVFHQ